MRTAKYSEATTPTSVPAGMVAPASPYRVALMIAPMSDTTIYVSPDANAAALSGIPVTQASGPLTLRIEEVGDAVQWPWYAKALTSASAVAVVDVRAGAAEERR